ncbi:MAG: hypothetical protein ABTQ25_14245 [Nitrosomonas ureae]
MKIKELGPYILDECRKQGWAGLETGISRPVPKIISGELYMSYLLYRSQIQFPYQLLYEPFGFVIVNISTDEIISYSRLPTTEPARLLGRYPHAAAAAIARDQWQIIWAELFDLYSDILSAFAGRNVSNQPEKVRRFSQLFDLTTPPYMHRYYQQLNPSFFEWLESIK